MHSMNERPCRECGDLDGCHLRVRLKRFRDSVQAFRDDYKTYGIEVPQVVCLCGSTRFMDAFQKAKYDETLAGRIVLSIGCDTKSDGELFFGQDGEEVKRRLDTLHLRKIDFADEVLILNVGGYIGDSTRRELEYAHRTGKKIRSLEPLFDAS